ncbi:MAG: glutaredoxin [Candidatus Helarchaeota archaeon]|nr:glutaredoxin [Candidatus Helarchaeota archaeon]
MDYKTVPGKYNKHKVKIYTISTCMWCTRLKRKLNQNDIEYTYLDIDLLSLSEKTEIKSQLRQYRRILAFPMMFVDDKFIENQYIDQKIQDLVKDA